MQHLLKRERERIGSDYTEESRVLLGTAAHSFCIAWLVSWLVWVSAGTGTESVNVVGVGLESKSFEDDAVLQCNRDVRKTNRKHSDRDFSP